MGHLDKFNDAEGECLSLVYVQNSDLIKVTKQACKPACRFDQHYELQKTGVCEIPVLLALLVLPVIA
jgi:hypothetical protein